MTISITLHAQNLDELSRVMADMADKLSGVSAPVGPPPSAADLLELVNTALAEQGLCATIGPRPGGAVVAPPPVTQGPATEPAKKKRGRPRKNPETEPSSPAPTQAAPASPEPEDTEPEPAKADDLDPAGCHAAALELLLAVFNKHGSGSLQSLRDKYGEARMSSIPESKGVELLEDARALAAELGVEG